MLSKEETFMTKNKIGKSDILDYQVLEGMADWVRVVDVNHNVLYSNKTMKESFPEGLEQRKCYEIHEIKKECKFCITNRSILTGETVQKEENIRGRYYSVKSSPIANSKGEIYAAVEVFRDVTRERKLELQLIEKNKKMSRDLQFAKRIQERILPRKGRTENISLDYIYRPSEMLSGDMFDIFYIDDNHIGIYISDVAGHGVAASMMTMFIRQTMRALSYSITSPSISLAELHKSFILLNLEADKYFTIFYGVINIRTLEFRYANAGHNCIPIKYKNMEVELELELLEINGLPISSLGEKMIYTEKTMQLSLGDRILFYTDGITEAKDQNGEEFGVEGVLRVVKENPNNLLKEIEENIINHIWEEQKDDFALVLMEVVN